jgi:hypothetical protein
MNPETLEALSAFMDGEAVDPQALATALLAPGGRESLLAFARLRSALADDDSRPSDGFYRRMSPQLGRQQPRGRWASRVLRIAASLVVLALAARGATDFLRRSSDEPPRADRVLRFTPGVDWHESSQGQKE